MSKFFCYTKSLDHENQRSPFVTSAKIKLLCSSECGSPITSNKAASQTTEDEEFIIEFASVSIFRLSETAATHSAASV